MKAYAKFLSTFLAVSMVGASLAGCTDEKADKEKETGSEQSSSLTQEEENENLEKELEETKKQLEEALKENAELKGETSESSSEAPAEDENSKETSEKAEKAESKPAENKPVEKPIEVQKPAETNPDSNNSSVPEWQVDLSTYIPKEGATSEGLPDYLLAFLDMNNPIEYQSWIDEGKVPKNFDLYLARQEYNAGIGPYRGGSTTGAPADWSNIKKPAEESKPDSNNSSVPSWQVDLSTYVPAPNATTEGLPEYLWDYLEMNNNKDTTKWKEEGIVPQNFDIYFARQEYNAGIGPYRGGTTTGAPADWGDSGKPDSPEYDAPIPSDETFESGSREEAEEVIRLANEYRTKAGLSAVSIDEHLMDVAAIRAKETSEKFDHERPNGEMDQYCAAPTYSWVMCNLHYGASDPSGAVKAWMRSPDHKRNMMYPDHDIVGAASYKKGSITYWVIIFATYDGQYPNY